MSGRRLTALGWQHKTAAALLLALLIAVPLTQRTSATAQSASPQEPVSGPPGFRRLNEGQYVRAIDQAFGAGLKVPGRFDPPLREGLMAIGDSRVTVTPSGIEQYELRAREIAAQVLSEGRRRDSVTCVPASPNAFDADCAKQFFENYGLQLYRRPLSEREQASLLEIAFGATGTSKDFYKGLETGLSRLLVSPHFIFRVERADPNVAGRLDDWSLATRISFLLWDAPPDAELLAATARGDLSDPVRLANQIDRLMASPRFEQGVRSFFSDMLGFEQFQGLAKDQAIYPKFNSQIVLDAREQTLLTIIDHLIASKGDYRDLLTTRKTFMNRSLGALYKVPVSEAGMSGWAPYSFPADGERAGILSLAGFLMLDPTHEGRGSPTIRGKAVREHLLCQVVPQPPPDVDFAIVQDVGNPLYKTARQRLTKHRENPSCAACHELTDPIGLSMENFDAVGDYRTTENGATIDVSSALDGKAFVGLKGLAQRLRQSPEVPACLVQRAYEYGVGRDATGADYDAIEKAKIAFAARKYRFPDLMRWIALSPAFAMVSAEPSAEANTIAAR